MTIISKSNIEAFERLEGCSIHLEKVENVKDGKIFSFKTRGNNKQLILEIHESEWEKLVQAVTIFTYKEGY